MQEDFLHYIWKHKKFEVSNVKTIHGDLVFITSVGTHNLNSGPDFFNAQIRIGKQLWAGNVEIHVKSSDWYLHNHETDVNYDNVILHVVWEYDTDVFRKDHSKIPTLELKQYVSKEALNNYVKLFSKTQKWINCEHDFPGVDDFIVNHWLERLYVERLEKKSETIQELLKASKNDWEAVLFKMLIKNFGLKVNADAFLSISNSIVFSIIRKLQSNAIALESLFMGQAGLLEDDIQEVYYLNLQKEYHFLKRKFNLSNQNVLPIQFFRLRPPNFPTIRLSQFASLYNQNQNLFSKVIELKTITECYDLFSVTATSFWESHYTFSKTSKASKKMVTKSFIDLLLINTIIPIKFCYALKLGKQMDEDLLKLIQKIASEKNNIVDKFESLKPIAKSALQSQALIQLKNEYCIKNRCLHCAIGSAILVGNH
ncbi:MAG: DUF2851 family protein [Flavobacteriales bacterium]|nr:DUF2851 family protein [Flavobacteriia bacterium]NCP04798.1 DUF2851 family protein [Flavobacteriales bacterium]PIV92683.1 MAG: DUF2851 domain-containing protein [Flavobacteriaceae bacterium CG17_big_fil_post_rev_8_21_14_2_50_33_15]PIY11145.1 MAG: DUF2851 domain-containing protein [Flavobacteriaceae bacterium CG_4_10_14_3_um_filter_33_47]PJB17830.1 MAG: DUF2851 domain-containing protein [Flavobacteriaceae bacterium CG_4_9_14_3_um_filter_33_16]